ncbi:MAG: hypothetical protein HIU91_11930 [Acidobacteria bacterium]|nr:hypothetical protein [Acidobacteriota bacterium]
MYGFACTHQQSPPKRRFHLAFKHNERLSEIVPAGRGRGNVHVDDAEATGGLRQQR